MQLSDYAQALGAAQRLVPNVRDLRQQDAQTQGLELRNQALAQDMALQQRTADFEAQEQTQFRSALEGLGAKPSPDRLYQLGIRFPKFAQTINQAAKAVTEDRRAGVVRQLAPIQALIQNGQTDKALAEVERHIAADKAAGQEPDENDVELRDMLASKDPAQIKAAGGIVYGLLAAVNPDTAAANVLKSQEQTDTARKGQVVGRAIGHYDEQGKWVTDYRDPDVQYRTIQNADGSESIVQVSGAEGGGPVSGGSGAAPGSGAPRSVRNNNPGNLRASAFTRKLPGFKSVDADGFAVFDSPSSGAAAQGALLGSYIDRGYNTVAKIINRWAPPSDNNDTGAYIKSVAKALNVAPGQVLTKDAIPQLQSIISRVEGGPGSSSRGTGNARPASGGGAKVLFTSKPSEPNAVDQESVRFYAEKVATGGDLPQLGSGKESSQWRRAILQEAARIQTGRGVNGGESNLAQADVKASRSALLQAQKQYTSTVGFEDTFQRNVKEVLRLAPQGVGGSSPIFNRWIQAGRKNVSGDPAVSAFNVAVNTAANEYAKLASGASGGAVTSDSARHEAMEILNNAQTLPQLRAAIRQMQIDGHNRVIALDTQLDRLRGNIRGAGGGRSAAPVRAVPQGGKLVGMYQGRQVYQLPNGKRVVAK